MAPGRFDAALVHQLAAAAHEAHRVLERSDVGGVIRGELAERMAGRRHDARRR